MEYNVDIIESTGVKHPAADALIMRNTNAMDDSGINDDIKTMAVATCAQRILSEDTKTTLENILMETN